MERSSVFNLMERMSLSKLSFYDIHVDIDRSIYNIYISDHFGKLLNRNAGLSIQFLIDWRPTLKQ